MRQRLLALVQRGGLVQLVGQRPQLLGQRLLRLARPRTVLQGLGGVAQLVGFGVERRLFRGPVAAHLVLGVRQPGQADGAQTREAGDRQSATGAGQGHGVAGRGLTGHGRGPGPDALGQLARRVVHLEGGGERVVRGEPPIRRPCGHDVGDPHDAADHGHGHHHQDRHRQRGAARATPTVAPGRRGRPEGGERDGGTHPLQGGDRPGPPQAASNGGEEVVHGRAAR